MRYGVLAEFYEELGKTTKRLEKTKIIVDLLKKSSKEDLTHVPYLIRGKVFPEKDERKIGFSSQLAVKAIAQATGAPTSKITSLWRKKGDLGKVAELLVRKKKQRTLASSTLTVKKVHENIQKLATLIGTGTVSKKVSLVAELISSAKPIEARYIIRTIIEKMRVGVAEGVIRDAIAKACNVESKEIEKAYNLVLDYAEVMRMAKGKRLSQATLLPSRPSKVMLAIRVETLPEAFKAVGKPALFEYKFDGFRVTIHKKENTITLFSRRMENVTNQFPDIVKDAKECIRGKSYIIDTEVVGYDKKTGKYLPFQKISQRIKRKHNIHQMVKDYPVEVNAFDVLYYNGKSYMKETQINRRKLLDKIIKNKKFKVKTTPKLITDSESKAQAFFKESLKNGNEGLMVKSLDEVYKPGRRVGGWVKYKSFMEPLDLVIVGAQWGEGKRSKWLSSFDLACRGKGKLLKIGKVGTGIKEKSEGVTFKELTKKLKPFIKETKGQHVVVKPKLVVEIGYEEIQKSQTYDSGYALRFPRLLRLRESTKRVSDANTLQDVQRLYKHQKKT